MYIWTKVMVPIKALKNNILCVRLGYQRTSRGSGLSQRSDIQICHNYSSITRACGHPRQLSHSQKTSESDNSFPSQIKWRTATKKHLIQLEMTQQRWGTGLSPEPSCFSSEADWFSCTHHGNEVDVYRGIFIAEVKRQLQVCKEEVGEFRIHVQHLQNLLPLNGVKVAVAQRSHVCARLPGLGEQVDHLTENVVLTWRRGCC